MLLRTQPTVSQDLIHPSKRKMSVALLKPDKAVHQLVRQSRSDCPAREMSREKLSCPGTNLEGIFLSRKGILDLILPFPPLTLLATPSNLRSSENWIHVLFTLLSGNLIKAQGSTLNTSQMIYTHSNRLAHAVKGYLVLHRFAFCCVKYVTF